jgi:hypothetical protein
MDKARLSSLEAGPHAVRVPGHPIPLPVNIPAALSQPVNLTVTIEKEQKKTTEETDPDTIYAP